MNDLELAQAIEQLSPANLQSVLTALLICQQTANHGDHSFPVNGGKLIKLFDSRLSIQGGNSGGVRKTEPRKKTDVSLRIAS